MFKSAVGMNEIVIATSMTIGQAKAWNVKRVAYCVLRVAFKARQNCGSSGKNTIAHGKPSGRLLAFAPTNNAADQSENAIFQKRHFEFAPEPLVYRLARNAKSIIASAYTVGNASFATPPA